LSLVSQEGYLQPQDLKRLFLKAQQVGKTGYFCAILEQRPNRFPDRLGTNIANVDAKREAFSAEQDQPRAAGADQARGARALAPGRGAVPTPFNQRLVFGFESRLVALFFSTLRDGSRFTLLSSTGAGAGTATGTAGSAATSRSGSPAPLRS
jgi:hypothetical protein